MKLIKISIYLGERGGQNLRCRYPRLPYTPRSLLMPDLLDIQYLCIKSGHVSASTGVDIQRSMIWFLQMAQLSTTISHAHSATAFHYADD